MAVASAISLPFYLINFTSTEVKIPSTGIMKNVKIIGNKSLINSIFSPYPANTFGKNKSNNTNVTITINTKRSNTPFIALNMWVNRFI